MPNININDIFPGSVLKDDLYHIGSGKIILKKGELLSDQKIEILESLNIDSVFKGISAFEIEDFLHSVNFKAINIDNSMVGKSFTTPLYDRKKRILVEANIPITDTFMRLIVKGGGIVYQLKSGVEIDTTIVDEYLAQVSKISSSASLAPVAQNELKVTTLEKAEIKQKDYGFSEASEIIPEGVKINSDFVDADLTKRKKPQKVEIVADAALLQMGVKDPLAKRTDSYKAIFYDTYLALMNDVSALFKNISTNASVKVDAQVKAICSRVVNTLIADKNLVINLTTLRNQNSDYLVQHSLNVAIYSINIGCSIGYSENQIFELTCGALLADLGLMKINKDLLTKPSILTNEERRLVERHPSFSLDYLNLIKGMPSSLPYIIYQSHEKLDGTGYPKNRPAFLIHEFAKIIAIADTFDSLCTDRPWRSAMTPYKAMEEIIRLAGQKKIDGKIIRQWLFSISLFPVGSYVNLNDSLIAKVISASPTDFTRPNLRAMLKDGVNLDAPSTIILSENKAFKITRAVPQKELQFNVLDGF